MTVRVRFAPSPTGFMHLGNVRAAAFNYLFARQHRGTFILRIEDTDANRNLEEAKARIVQDLAWLKLDYSEGPEKGGAYGPYIQSLRTHIYQQQLDELILHCKVYRCFCSAIELEEKRAKQIAMGKPPRYARTCGHFSDDKIKLKLAAGAPFIWRFRINEDQLIEINDLGHGSIKFELKNFGDFALTRPDGSFTFMFANFVDDWMMNITHVIRGEDHLSNTAMQAALYDAFAVKLPIFWHLPIICNKDGVKLSKRDFGFSLDDLRIAGYLPEAINNYIATIGASFTQEIQSTAELAQNYNFKNMHSTGAIRYDVEKLTWFNHKWIEKLELADLVKRIKPFLLEQHPEADALSDEKLTNLVSKVRTDLRTLKDVGIALAFYFAKPIFDRQSLDNAFGEDKATIALGIVASNLPQSDNPDIFIQAIKEQAQAQGLKTKEIFGTVRYLLTGRFEGVGMHDLLTMLDHGAIKDRLSVR